MELELKEYDKVLIGIGDDFNTKTDDSCKNSWEELIFIENHVDSNIIAAFNHLQTVLEDTDHFIVTTCNDDLIYRSNLDEKRIVTPCGGFRYLQCIDDCSHELLPYESAMYESHEQIVCPHCKKPVVFNRMPIDNYNEGGYMEQWQEYNKWLQSTINKKLLILELGVGMAYPSVIRFPFEKTAFYNQKSIMYRVHESLAFSTPELKERCVCVKANPVEFLNNL